MSQLSLPAVSRIAECHVRMVGRPVPAVELVKPLHARGVDEQRAAAGVNLGLYSGRFVHGDQGVALPLFAEKLTFHDGQPDVAG
jgi:hypothetical protein